MQPPQDDWDDWFPCSWCDGSGWGECSCLSDEGHNPRFCDRLPCTHCDGTGEGIIQQILEEERNLPS